MSKIITVSNPKGGVGKTTTVINLAASLTIAEKKVLIIDLDPNGAISTGLGLQHNGNQPGIYEVLLGTASLTDSIRYPYLPNLDIIPCELSNSEQENRLMDMAKNRVRLKSKLGELMQKEKSEYDFILLDTPPGLTNLTFTALCASSSVLIPLQCGYYAIRVVERLFRLVHRIKTSINPGLEIEGVLLNFFDNQTKESRRAASEARRLFKNLVFQTVIPKNTAIGFAAFDGKPTILVDASAKGAQAYLALAQEILRKNRRFKWSKYSQKFDQKTYFQGYSILEY